MLEIGVQYLHNVRNLSFHGVELERFWEWKALHIQEWRRLWTMVPILASFDVGHWFCTCVELCAIWLFLGSTRHLNLALFLSVDRVTTYLRGRWWSRESGGTAFLQFCEAFFCLFFFLIQHAILFNAHQCSSCCRSTLGSSAQDGWKLGSKSWKRL